MDGELDEALIYPDLPAIFSPLINTMNSLDDLSYQEIKAYTELTGVKLDWFDIEILKQMDNTKNSVANGRSVNEIIGAT